MKHTLLSFIILVFCWTGSQAQVAINTNGANPATSSMLDVSSTNKGMLMPRMASSQRKAILNPEPGLLVYDTDRQTIYLFDGQKWRPMMAATEETAPLVSRYPVGARQGSEFGAAADIYNTYVAVGAPSDSAQGVICGAVYIYSRENNNWQQKVKLSPPNATSGEHFGTAVCLFGDLLAVGAPGKTINGATSRGAVYLFKRNGEVWDFYLCSLIQVEQPMIDLDPALLSQANMLRLGHHCRSMVEKPTQAVYIFSDRSVASGHINHLHMQAIRPTKQNLVQA